MFSLIRLLTEEPAKLERLGIFISKFLIVLYIVMSLGNIQMDVTSLNSGIVIQSNVIANIIFFSAYIVFVWFILWDIIGNLFFGETLVRWLSKIGNDKEVFEGVLVYLKIIKKQRDSISPTEKSIAFWDFLKSFNDQSEKELSDAKSRIRKYYLLLLVTLGTLLISKDMDAPIWLICGGGYFLLNLFFLNILIHKMNEYFIEHRNEMEKLFGRLAYSQMIINAIEQNPFFKNYYDRSDRWIRIHLTRKDGELDELPETMKIYPQFYWNDMLMKASLDEAFKKSSKRVSSVEKIGKHYDIVISNIKPDDTNVTYILAQSSFAYLHCESEEEIYKNLELFLFKVTNGFYRIH